MFPITPTMILWVAFGGAIGALLRFFVQHYATVMLGSEFPWGTLFVNVLGSLIIGVISGYWLQSGFEVSNEMRGALIIGCLGAFTTFSAFSLDTLILFQNGEVIRASLNVLTTVASCLIAVAVGSTLGGRIAG